MSLEEDARALDAELRQVFLGMALRYPFIARDEDAGSAPCPGNTLTPARARAHVVEALRSFGDAERVEVHMRFDMATGNSSFALHDARSGALLGTAIEAVAALRGLV